MPPLERAVPGPEPHRLAGSNGQDLDLDVLRPSEVPLQVDVGRTEIGLGLPDGGSERGLHVAGRPGDLQATATTTTGRLDRYRVAVTLPEGMHLLDVANGLERTRHHRHAGRLGEPPGPDLVARGLE